MSENIWEGILRDSVLHSKLPSGHVVFFGDGSCGKTSLLRTFCVAEHERASFSHANTEILSFDFFDATDASDDFDRDVTDARVNVWSLNNDAFLDVLDVALNPTTITQMIAMVGVDLSKPETSILQAKKWLRVFEQRITKTTDQLSANQKNSLLERVDSTVRRVKTQQATKSDDDSSHSAHSSWKNLGVPLIIVGCKADAQETTDHDGLLAARSILAELRSLSLHYGGALVYTSASQETNCKALHRYLLHRLYPQSFNNPMEQPRDGVLDAFIPAGSDAAEIIRAVGGIDPIAYANAYTSEVIAASVKNDTREEVPEDEVLEDEQSFLSQSQQYLDQSITGIASASRDTISAPAAVQEVAETRASAKQGEDVKTEVIRDFFQSLLSNPSPPKTKK